MAVANYGSDFHTVVVVEYIDTGSGWDMLAAVEYIELAQDTLVASARGIPFPQNLQLHGSLGSEYCMESAPH